MPTSSHKAHQPSPLLQFVINFVIPILILTKFSSEAQLGPIKAMLLALAFPVTFEIYNVYKRKKVSILSIVAIGGILVTGAISLLGLSEGWLAVRRSVPYFAVSLAMFISILLNRSLLNTLLPQVLDMEKINTSAKKNNAKLQLSHLLKKTGYVLSLVFLAIGVSSFVLTRIIINSNTGTAAFNQEYVRLRLLSLPFTTIPILIGVVISMLYLFTGIEKLTGLKTEDLTKKK